MSLLISQCPALEYVSLPPVSALCSRALANSPALQCICLEYVLEVDQCHEAVSCPYPALNTVIMSAKLDQIMSFMRMLDGRRNLTSIDLNCLPSRGDIVPKIIVLLGMIARSCDATSLSALELRDKSLVTLNGMNPPYTIPSTHLHPFLAFHGLRFITIQLRGHIDIDDDDVEVFAQSWPLLRQLCLIKTLTPAMYELPGPSGVPLVSLKRIRTTPKCLISLALYCPRLRYLSIPIDLSSLPESGGDPAGGGVVHHHLETLRVGPVMGRELDIEETMSAVAMFLSCVFPSLRSVGSVLSWVPDVQVRFEELSNLLRKLANARQEERTALGTPGASQQFSRR